MNDGRIENYLDGEADLEGLDDDARAEARSWERVLAAFRAAHPSTPAPPWLEDRVMTVIQALPEPGAVGRAWAWLLRPWTVRLSPAAVGLLAMLVLALALEARRGAPTRAVTRTGAPVVYVQFSLVAPGARSVAVGGDFDQWRGAYALEDPGGNGVWTGRVPLRPGVHTYMFLVDGSRWVTDPRATSHIDDGFGNEDAVLAVAAPQT